MREYVYYLVGKNKSVVKFEDAQNREMSDSSLLYLCGKEEAGKEVDKTKYGLPKRRQGGFFNY